MKLRRHQNSESQMIALFSGARMASQTLNRPVRGENLLSDAAV